jgi:hypothetical protein
VDSFIFLLPYLLVFIGGATGSLLQYLKIVRLTRLQSLLGTGLGIIVGIVTGYLLWWGEDTAAFAGRLLFGKHSFLTLAALSVLILYQMINTSFNKTRGNSAVSSLMGVSWITLGSLTVSANDIFLFASTLLAFSYLTQVKMLVNSFNSKTIWKLLLFFLCMGVVLMGGESNLYSIKEIFASGKTVTANNEIFLFGLILLTLSIGLLSGLLSVSFRTFRQAPYSNTWKYGYVFVLIVFWQLLKKEGAFSLLKELNTGLTIFAFLGCLGYSIEMIYVRSVQELKHAFLGFSSAMILALTINSPQSSFVYSGFYFFMIVFWTILEDTAIYKDHPMVQVPLRKLRHEKKSHALSIVFLVSIVSGVFPYVGWELLKYFYSIFSLSQSGLILTLLTLAQVSFLTGSLIVTRKSLL